jgi:hypothetical protein
MSEQAEIWRVSTAEGTFETNLETLQQWVREGCVAPTDKVSKGSLKWIDAGKVPQLKIAFSEQSTPTFNATEAVQPGVAAQSGNSSEYREQEEFYEEATHQHSTPNNGPTNVCCNHPDRPTSYVCRICAGSFCKDCPNFSVGNIPLCPLCGDLCRPYQEITAKVASQEFRESGFGLDDFKRAITYPLQHKMALVFGALMYGLLLLAGFRGSLIAWMIMFGCISHVISQVAWGRLNRSFMPDFSAFSLFDDLVVPVFLGLGITIVSWGPVLVLALALIFGVIGPGAGTLAREQMQVAAQNSGPSPEDLSALTDPNADPKKLEEANAKLNQLRPGAQIANEAERSKQVQSDPTPAISALKPFLGAGIVLLLLMSLAIVWGVFYSPMALAVAGYTQSFASVVNPAVGIDTIKRMGSTYFKAFGMVLLVQIVALVVGVTVATITKPFALPFVGNLPANFINGVIAFYFNLVIACVLGLSLYKCADRLGISVD